MQTISLLQRLVADRVRVRGRPEGSFSRQPDDTDGTAVVDTVLADQPVVVVAVAARVEELLTVFTDLIVMKAPESRRTSTASSGLRANGFFATIVSFERSDAPGRTDRLANLRILEIVCISLASRPEELVTIFAFCTVVVATNPAATWTCFQRLFTDLDPCHCNHQNRKLISGFWVKRQQDAGT